MKESGTKKRKGREERGWGEMKESGREEERGERRERVGREESVCVCGGGAIRKRVGRVT